MTKWNGCALLTISAYVLLNYSPFYSLCLAKKVVKQSYDLLSVELVRCGRIFLLILRNNGEGKELGLLDRSECENLQVDFTPCSVPYWMGCSTSKNVLEVSRIKIGSHFLFLYQNKYGNG